MIRPGDREAGMVLLNVLIIVALASAVAAAMILAREQLIARALAFTEAEQALVLAEGGELTVVTALRRDAKLAPESDHWREAWVKGVAQRETAIEGGSFSLAVSDGQALFNINNLASSSSGQALAWRAIAARCGLAPEATARVQALVLRKHQLDALEDLRQAGLTPGEVERLGAFVTVLPTSSSTINLNTAPDALLGVLVTGPAPAQGLLELRRRRGYLSRPDFAALGLAPPPETGFTTNYVRVRTRVRVGETRQTLESLLVRRDGGAEVIARTRLP